MSLSRVVETRVFWWCRGPFVLHFACLHFWESWFVTGYLAHISESGGFTVIESAPPPFLVLGSGGDDAMVVEDARSDSPYDEAIHTTQEADVPSPRPVRAEPALGGGVGGGTWGLQDSGHCMALHSVTDMAGVGAGARSGVGGLGSGQVRQGGGGVEVTCAGVNVSSASRHHSNNVTDLGLEAGLPRAGHQIVGSCSRGGNARQRRNQKRMAQWHARVESHRLCSIGMPGNLSRSPAHSCL